MAETDKSKDAERPNDLLEFSKKMMEFSEALGKNRSVSLLLTKEKDDKHLDTLLEATRPDFMKFPIKCGIKIACETFIPEIFEENERATLKLIEKGIVERLLDSFEYSAAEREEMIVPIYRSLFSLNRSTENFDKVAKAVINRPVIKKLYKILKREWKKFPKFHSQLVEMTFVLLNYFGFNKRSDEDNIRYTQNLNWHMEFAAKILASPNSNDGLVCNALDSVKKLSIFSEGQQEKVISHFLEPKCLQRVEKCTQSKNPQILCAALEVLQGLGAAYDECADKYLPVFCKAIQDYAKENVLVNPMYEDIVATALESLIFVLKNKEERALKIIETGTVLYVMSMVARNSYHQGIMLNGLDLLTAVHGLQLERMTRFIMFNIAKVNIIQVVAHLKNHPDPHVVRSARQYAELINYRVSPLIASWKKGEKPEDPYTGFNMELMNPHKAIASCGHCGSLAPQKRCSKCKKAAYCSRECQIADWKVHKTKCTP